MEKMQTQFVGPKPSMQQNCQPINNTNDPEILELNIMRSNSSKSMLPANFWSPSHHHNMKALPQMDTISSSIPIVVLPKSKNIKKTIEANLVIPRITFIEIIVEILSIFVFAYTWSYFVIGYKELPAQVPVKNNPEGKETTISRSFYFLIILGDSFAFCLLSVLQLVPHKFKYLVDITAENNLLVFLTTRKFILFIKFITLCMILYTTVALFKIAKQQWNPSLVYMIAFAVIPYSFGGWLYYKKLIKVTINPYA